MSRSGGNRERTRVCVQQLHLRFAGLDALLWQLTASVAMPGFTINRVVALAGILCADARTSLHGAVGLLQFCGFVGHSVVQEPVQGEGSLERDSICRVPFGTPRTWSVVHMKNCTRAYWREAPGREFVEENFSTHHLLSPPHPLPPPLYAPDSRAHSICEACGPSGHPRWGDAGSRTGHGPTESRPDVFAHRQVILISLVVDGLPIYGCPCQGPCPFSCHKVRSSPSSRRKSVQHRTTRSPGAAELLIRNSISAEHRGLGRRGEKKKDGESWRAPRRHSIPQHAAQQCWSVGVSGLRKFPEDGCWWGPSPGFLLTTRATQGGGVLEIPHHPPPP